MFSGTVWAQDPTPNVPPFLQSNPPPADGQQPPSGFPPIGQNQAPPQVTEEVVPQVPLEETTPEIDPATEEPQVDSSIQTAVNARLDLELIANGMMNGGRPEGWNGSLDATDAMFAVNTRIDLDLLATTLIGANIRPEGWFGVVASTPQAIARDIRHDLELLADAVSFTRPATWSGDVPIMQCDRATQVIVQFLELNGVFTLQADPTAPDFCQQATNEATLFMEVNLLANPTPNSNLSLQGVAVSGDTVIASEFAASFLDRGAARRSGTVPNDTPFQVVGRSPSQFSNMLLIRGDGFEVYVDYQFTSISEEAFQFIEPIDEETVDTFCTARWCNFN